MNLARRDNLIKERATSAGLIVFRRTKEGPKFLIVYHRGKYWNFPKGHIEARENSLSAAIREVWEEVGLGRSDLHIKNGFRVKERFQFIIDNRRVYKTVILYLAETNRKSIRIDSSGREEGCGWFLYRDAKRLFEGYKASQVALKKAANFIRRISERTQEKFLQSP
ncbi:MAG: hypothetical protein A2Y84_00545 [Candidatus Colwellbacteria bacterium RBG_13_48_8]|uniref:Nudix hydrolase domain-containing protein n=1 Tax=Candidatus Colwellbacteria bacterium RBG_13_48_8 TaxID=1797685 RepID=A0A1G1YWL6_9BACT|nr:MAG: hypothetical protein A2Y84_00545 [Candidatus Colwellbacteria bacterium RBG_13_48_8]